MLQRMPSGKLGRTSSGRRARCGDTLPCFPDSMFPNARVDYAITGHIITCTGQQVNFTPSAGFVIRAGACLCVAQALPVIVFQFTGATLRVTYWWDGVSIRALALIIDGSFLYFVGTSGGVRFDTQTNFSNQLTSLPCNVSVDWPVLAGVPGGICGFPSHQNLTKAAIGGVVTLDYIP